MSRLLYPLSYRAWLISLCSNENGPGRGAGTAVCPGR
jgi:hypothetical protein